MGRLPRIQPSRATFSSSDVSIWPTATAPNPVLVRLQDGTVSSSGPETPTRGIPCADPACLPLGHRNAVRSQAIYTDVLFLSLDWRMKRLASTRPLSLPIVAKHSSLSPSPNI
uniref:Uncharacterized protein n=1 Tax=Mycena chlorophos TaxID=658473 RepID=A0ABQ0LDR6_MYCCL|nr:predicted protein [Mycena chlorophos]